MKIAAIRGPYSRPNGMLLWEYLHNNYDDVSVTAFGSDPERYDLSQLNLPTRNLSWPDGKLSAFGYDYLPWSVLNYLNLPSSVLLGLREVAAEFDILHVPENYHAFSLQTALLSRLEDKPFYIDVHENIPFRPNSHLTWTVKRIVNATADGVMTSTIPAKRALIHEGVDPDDITVIPNVIDFEHFDRGAGQPEQFGLPDRLREAFTIVFVHGLREQKGTPYLLRAFDRLLIDHDDVNLVLVGANDLSDEMYASRVEGNPNVFHLESIPNTEIESLYNLSDVYVLPSVTVEDNEEQFGFSVLESMACGLPSVVTDVGGLPYVVEGGETSIVVEERSVEALHGALDRLYRDENLRARLGETAYSYVRETYAPDVVGDRLYEFYTGCL